MPVCFFHCPHQTGCPYKNEVTTRTQEVINPALAMLLVVACDKIPNKAGLDIEPSVEEEDGLTLEAPGFWLVPWSKPKRRKTSEQVTRMEMMIRMMMIQVISCGNVSFRHRHPWGCVSLSLTRHLSIGNGVTENLGKIKKDLASLVEHLDARLDFQIFPHCLVKGMQRWLVGPKETRHVENVGGCPPSRVIVSRFGGLLFRLLLKLKTHIG
jgi:hypothetical protein